LTRLAGCCESRMGSNGTLEWRSRSFEFIRRDFGFCSAFVCSDLESIRPIPHGLGLKLSTEKTRIVHLDEGFDFLGWHYQGTKRWPRQKSIDKLRHRFRAMTRGNRPGSLKSICAELPQCNGGGSTSSVTVIACRHLPRWTNGCDDDCVACCGGVTNAGASVVAATITVVGPTRLLFDTAFSR